MVAAPHHGREMSGPRHVLMTADAVGGVLHYALDLAQGLSARGVRTTLALLGPAPNEGQRQAAARVPGLKLVQTGLPLDWLAEDAEIAERTALAIAELAHRHEAEIVHLNSPSLALAPYDRAVVSALHSCVASWWTSVRQGAMPEDFHWRTALTRRGIAASGAFVCPSAAFADQAECIYDRRPMVVHNGRAPPKALATRARAPFAVTLGRLWDAGKNIATLDAAASFMDLPILAAGPTEGPNGARIEPVALGVLGPVGEGEVRALLGYQPIFVSSALYEPFGLAVLEAAQAGCALVLSDIPTFRELWDGAALFVAPRDAEGFAATLFDLAKDEERRAALGTAARQRAERYTIGAMAERMFAIYDALAQPAGSQERGVVA